MSNFCREVITLQLGHYSNFVGTHWWNLQDASLSYDGEMAPSHVQSDVLFREGQTTGGHVTHTPRLIAMDLKGSLRTLRQEGSLYDAGNDTSAVTWEGNLLKVEESPAQKNSFLEDLDRLDKGEILGEEESSASPQPQCPGAVRSDTVNSQLARVQKGYQLEGSVKVWSDFLRIHLHPRTISVIHQYNHDGETHRLKSFGQGEALLHGPVLEQLEDKLHFFVEECDYLQGFQIFCDLADGFAGLGSKVTEMLRDSYGGRGILTWGMAPVSHPDTTPMRELYHVLNGALGVVNMAEHSSFFCPLTLRGGLGRRPSAPTVFPLLNYDAHLWYHSSAVLALALDALTLPYRLKEGGVPMWQVADSLAVSGRKVVAAFGALPFPMMHGGSLPDALSACADALPWQPLSACPEAADGRCYGQWATLRGFEGQRLVSSVVPGTRPHSHLHGLHSGEDVLESYIQSFYPSSPLALQFVSSPSLLTPPFPQIFSQSLGAQGFLQSRHPPPGSRAPAVSSVPVLTSLQSSPAVGSWLSELHRGASALDLHRVAPSFLSQGPEMDDYKEALEELRLLGRCYRDLSGGAAHTSSEDDDDDD
ncbi:protein misato homolog 1 [Pseudoliparis swirei]|uniref:protein misato homolog 1 n=1 Tax=Pseudoliparis swirei TaxID=2059687 RepID=UPI0024BE6E97|nr:protein misato homolog 1 [Pseudoliparis swirei]